MELGRLVKHRAISRTAGVAALALGAGCVGASSRHPGARASERGALLGRGDAHVHLSYGRPDQLDSLLAHGITAVRDCGGDLAQLLRWRAEIAAGTRRGPRLYVAGPVLDGPKEGAEYRLTVATAAEAERAVDSLAAAGVDFIKTHSAIPRAAFFAVLRQARVRGLRVAAHLPRGVPAWVAADSGVGSIEHAAESILASPIYAGVAADVPAALRWWRSPAGDSAMRQLAARGVTVVPTLVRYEASITTAATPERRAARGALLPDLLDLVGRLHRAGVPLLVGSDLVGFPVGVTLPMGPAREVELLERAGLSPAAARASASASALARWFEPRQRSADRTRVPPNVGSQLGWPSRVIVSPPRTPSSAAISIPPAVSEPRR